jgi:hypothetical protein
MMARMRDDRHRLLDMVSPEDNGFAKMTGRLYTWFSPLGDRNHDATHSAAITTRPMKME